MDYKPIPIKDILEGVEKYSSSRPVRIHLEEGFNFSEKFHLLERVFFQNKIPYYFAFNGSGNSFRDYEIDLTEVEIIY